jgi:hypothetical protein
VVPPFPDPLDQGLDQLGHEPVREQLECEREGGLNFDGSLTIVRLPSAAKKFAMKVRRIRSAREAKRSLSSSSPRTAAAFAAMLALFQ